MREPTTVDLRVAADGSVTVLAFTWQGRTQRVAGHGRHRQDNDGVHYLVMTPDSHTFELLQTPEGQWFVVGSGAGRRLV